MDRGKGPAVSRPPRSIPKVRVNLDLPPASKAQLERLRDITEADSMSEVVRRALALYEAVIEATGTAERIEVTGKDGASQLILI